MQRSFEAHYAEVSLSVLLLILDGSSLVTSSHIYRGPGRLVNIIHVDIWIGCISHNPRGIRNLPLQTLANKFITACASAQYVLVYRMRFLRLSTIYAFCAYLHHVFFVLCFNSNVMGFELILGLTQRNQLSQQPVLSILRDLLLLLV